MTWMGLLLFSVWNFTGCGYERLQKRLDVQEFDHWYALRVYMSEDQRKTYLKYKTKDERDAYLKWVYGIDFIVTLQRSAKPSLLGMFNLVGVKTC